MDTLKIFKKILKIASWTISIIILLLITIILLVQVPFIQNKIVQKATIYLRNKTHAEIDIKKIGIAFPKSVFIEGLFVKDLKKDTLLYAGEIDVNMDMISLINKNIHFKSVHLSNITANINRTSTDTLFNYNFLITAFSDSTKKNDSSPVKAKPVIAIDKIDMQRIKLIYDDQYDGIVASTTFKKLELTLDQLDLDQQAYKINNLLIDELTGKVVITKKEKKVNPESKKQAPVISANKISIKNSHLTYEDSITQQSLITLIDNFKLTKSFVDLNSQHVRVGNLSLKKSTIRMNAVDGVKSIDTLSHASKNTTNWNVVVNEIDLDTNQLAYNIINKPILRRTFDPSHINYQNISLSAKNIHYSTDTIQGAIAAFSASDSGNFELKKLQTNFFMDAHSIIADKLIIQTSHSSIKSTAKVKYSSLEELKKEIENVAVSANIKKSKIHSRDILYFKPELIRLPFFKGASNSATISGNIKGTIGNIKGEKIVLQTASETNLFTQFAIVGLPNVETAYFDFPTIKLTTTKKDVVSLLGKETLPPSINLPNSMQLLANFKGKIKTFESKLFFTSDFGNMNVSMNSDNNENFNGNVQVLKFNLGKLLNDEKMYGPVNLHLTTNGKGLNLDTVNAKLKINVSEFYLNQYTYKNLEVNGTVSGKKFEGEIHLNDPNAAIDFNGLVNLNSGNEQYKFTMDLKGADLKKINITKDDFRIALVAVSDLKGNSVNTINGKAGITKALIFHNENKYSLDSVLFASINEKEKSEMSFNSAIVGIKYNGTFAPTDLFNEFKKFINNYFPVEGIKKEQLAFSRANRFNFEIQLHNHPILSEVLFPELKEFEPGIIKGNFDSETHNLLLDASINKLVYGTTTISSMHLNGNTEANNLNYKLVCTAISNSQVKLENFTIDGKLEDNKAFINVTSMNDQKNKKIAFKTELSKQDDNYKLIINPNEFYLANEQWIASDDNYFLFGKKGILIHHFSLLNRQSEISVTSVNNTFNDNIHATLKNFRLDDLSHIIEKDTNFVQGIVQGEFQLKRVSNTYGIVADMAVDNLIIKNITIGNIALKAENTTRERFNIDMALSGSTNTITAKGYYLPKDSLNALSFNLNIHSLSAKTVEAFSMGQIKDAEGNMNGNFDIKGAIKNPLITGSLTFKDVFINPSALNSRIQLQNQTIELNKNEVAFNSFTILDKNNHSAIINGNIKSNGFTDYNFALEIKTNNFLLMNTTARDNKELYGRVFIDSRIRIKGTPNLPIVNSTIKIKDGTNFTFAVPEAKLTTDRGESVVVFEDSTKLNSILVRNKSSKQTKNELKNFDISSSIEIDKKANLRLLVDPGSSDSLVVRGTAALSFTLDPSGKISLTGAYNLSDGSYLVSLENVVKKKFIIESGSTIIWNGDPLDAEININAIYSIRTSPIDLVAEQVATLSENEKNAYRQRYPFLIYLKLREALLKPAIRFEIQLPPDEKGILGGSVNAKLNQLNEDPSALNKQVFGLLVLNRFIQEDPLQSETNGVSTAARTTVGKLLSAQLNQLSSKVIPGVEVNFDVQSYDDYTSGTAEGRTEVEVALKKQLFNDRLSVQIGGTVDVEGEKAKQNSASEITGDVNIEYKMTKDGRYRLKGFRHNQYEGALEGQIVETGAGVLYVRDFDRWKELLFRSKKRKQNINKKADDTTVNK